MFNLVFLERKTKYVRSCCLQILVAWCVPVFLVRSLEWNEHLESCQGIRKTHSNGTISTFACTRDDLAGANLHCLSWNCTTFPTTSGFQTVQKSTLQRGGCPQSCVALVDNLGHSRLSAAVVQEPPRSFSKGKERQILSYWCMMFNKVLFQASLQPSCNWPGNRMECSIWWLHMGSSASWGFLKL